MRRASLLVLFIAIVAALAPATAFAQGPNPFGQGNSPFAPLSSQVIYDSTITPLPPHHVSQAFQANQVSEVGDEVTFAGSARTLDMVTVSMDSYACESEGIWNSPNCTTTPGDTFSVPITLHIYNVGAGDTLGSEIATMTDTFDIPYRPSASTDECNEGNSSVGYWYDSGTDTCWAGMAHNIMFDFSGQGVQLPDTAIWSVSFNTSTYGETPLGTQACSSQPQGCPYDALNLDLNPNVVVGSKPNPDTLWHNSATAGQYCDNGTAGTGSFRLDSPTSACWEGYVPAAQFTATSDFFSWAWSWWQDNFPFIFHNFN
ncbi:MAG: hypothetical protein WBW04_22325 [Nitrolancea sp.]